MLDPLETLWALAPTKIKLELSLNLIVEVLKVAEAQHTQVTLDDGKYEIVLNRINQPTVNENNRGDNNGK